MRKSCPRAWTTGELDESVVYGKKKVESPNPKLALWWMPEGGLVLSSLQCLGKLQL